jgi:hypothetical protein
MVLLAGPPFGIYFAKGTESSDRRQFDCSNTLLAFVQFRMEYHTYNVVPLPLYPLVTHRLQSCLRSVRYAESGNNTAAIPFCSSRPKHGNSPKSGMTGSRLLSRQPSCLELTWTALFIRWTRNGSPRNLAVERVSVSSILEFISSRNLFSFSKSTPS